VNLKQHVVSGYFDRGGDCAMEALRFSTIDWSQKVPVTQRLTVTS
jgi:hypothetical protein